MSSDPRPATRGFSGTHQERAFHVSYSRAFYVRFRCEDVDCHCDVEIRVRGCVTQDGGRLYEYATSKCPRCGHQLFRAHQLVGEVDRVKLGG